MADEINPDCERAFEDWWTQVLVGGSDTEGIAHESFCAGWEAARPLIAAAERERIYDELGHDHFVIFTEDGWTIEHSVDCRLSGRMHECDYHAAVARIAAGFEPDMAGRWLITAIDGNGEPALVRADLIGDPQ